MGAAVALMYWSWRNNGLFCGSSSRCFEWLGHSRNCLIVCLCNGWSWLFLLFFISSLIARSSFPYETAFVFSRDFWKALVSFWQSILPIRYGKKAGISLRNTAPPPVVTR